MLRASDRGLLHSWRCASEVYSEETLDFCISQAVSLQVQLSFDSLFKMVSVSLHETACDQVVILCLHLLGNVRCDCLELECFIFDLKRTIFNHSGVTADLRVPDCLLVLAVAHLVEKLAHYILKLDVSLNGCIRQDVLHKVLVAHEKQARVVLHTSDRLLARRQLNFPIFLVALFQA